MNLASRIGSWECRRGGGGGTFTARLLPAASAEKELSKVTISNAEVTRVLKILALPEKAYAVCGGALLARHGIRENVNDIDLLVLPPLFVQLSNLWLMLKHGSGGMIETPVVHIDGTKVEAFCTINFQDDGKLDAINFIGRAETIEGMPHVRIADMLAWKEQILAQQTTFKDREKHKHDVELMRKYLR